VLHGEEEAAHVEQATQMEQESPEADDGEEEEGAG
jgi:hypothetical protein